LMSTSVTLDTTFKQFVEEMKGLSLAGIKPGTVLYRKLMKEFNRLKQALLDEEERAFRQQVRMLPAEEGLEAVILAGIAYSGILAILGSM